MSSFQIRQYSSVDTAEILQMYYDTVHSVNTKDYSKQEVDAWVASPNAGLDLWEKRFSSRFSIVAEAENTIVGIANLDANGRDIDMLYVHKDYQGMGVASALLKELEAELQKNGFTESWVEASITAQKFFEKNGYKWVRDNQKTRKGITLRNFIQKKTFTP